jgi:hypothetical protein
MNKLNLSLNMVFDFGYYVGLINGEFIGCEEGINETNTQYSFVNSSINPIEFPSNAPLQLNGDHLIAIDTVGVEHRIGLQKTVNIDIEEIKLQQKNDQYYKFDLMYGDGGSSYSAASVIVVQNGDKEADLGDLILSRVSQALSLTMASDGNYALTSKYNSVVVQNIEKIGLSDFLVFKKLFAKEVY